MNFKLLLLLAIASTPLAMSSCAPIGVPYASTYDDGYNKRDYVTSLPYGYQTVYVSSTPYFFHNNYWYRRNNGRYYRTSRPHGYKGKLGRVSKRGYLTRLPGGYSPYTIGGIRYYNSGSSWYTYRGGRYYPSARPANFRPSNNIRGNRLNRGNSRVINRSNARSVNQNTTINRRVRSENLNRSSNATRLRSTRSTATNGATAQRTPSQRASRQNTANQRAANQRAQRAQRSTSSSTRTQADTSSGSTQQNSTQRKGRFLRSNY